MRAAILCYCWRNGEDAAHPMGVLPTDERLETVDSEGLNDVQTVFGEEQERASDWFTRVGADWDRFFRAERFYPSLLSRPAIEPLGCRHPLVQEYERFS
jgi:hypothetical protein